MECGLRWYIIQYQSIAWVIGMEAEVVLRDLKCKEFEFAGDLRRG